MCSAAYTDCNHCNLYLREKEIDCELDYHFYNEWPNKNIKIKGSEHGRDIRYIILDIRFNCIAVIK